VPIAYSNYFTVKYLDKVIAKIKWYSFLVQQCIQGSLYSAAQSHRPPGGFGERRGEKRGREMKEKGGEEEKYWTGFTGKKGKERKSWKGEGKEEREGERKHAETAGQL